MLTATQDGPQQSDPDRGRGSPHAAARAQRELLFLSADVMLS